MNKRLVTILMLSSLLPICSYLICSQQTASAQSMRPFVIPRVGDFLTYNNSAIKPDGSLNYTNVVWNLTFASSLSQDLFSITFQSFYAGLLFPSTSNPPNNGSYWVVDVASMIVTSTHNFTYITPSDLPMAFPFLFPTNVSVGSIITMTSQNPSNYVLTVVGEKNVTLYGTVYPCWNATGPSTSTETTTVLFTKSSGIVLYFDKHSTLNFESNVFQLLMARVGDYSLVSEFLPIIFLPLLIGASFVVVFFRKKQKNRTFQSN